MPTFGSATVADQMYTQHTAITALTLPRATGGNGTLTYRLAPAPPSGLSLDGATRRLTGTPDTVQGPVRYTWTVRDVDGDTDELTFTIEVVADLMPSFGDAVVADQTYTQNTAITALTLPEATGGDGTLTYRLTPSPPSGLSLDGGDAQTDRHAGHGAGAGALHLDGAGRGRRHGRAHLHDRGGGGPDAVVRRRGSWRTRRTRRTRQLRR